MDCCDHKFLFVVLDSFPCSHDELGRAWSLSPLGIVARTRTVASVC
jgi:hypothetical protein